MRPAAFGVEWRDRCLTLVEFGRLRDGHQEIRWASERFGDWRAVTGADVRRLLDQGGIRGRQARLGLSGNAVAIKPLRLPAVKPGERLAMVRMAGERFFLLPSEPRCYGLLGSADGEVVWAAAAHADEVTALLTAFRQAGVFVDEVTAAPSLYPRGLHRLAPAFGTAGARPIILRITDESAECVSYGPDGIAAVRTVRPVGEWESLRGLLDGPDKPGAVLLADGEFRFEAEPGVSVVDARVSAMPRPATLLGAAGAAARDTSPRPDLIPAPVHRRRRRASRRLTGALAAGAVALAVALVLLLGRAGTAQRAALEAGVREARIAAEPMLAAQDEIARITRELEAYAGIVEGRLSFLRRVGMIAAALPENAWLVSLELPNAGSAALNGYARSATAVLTALTRVEGFADVRFEQQPSKVNVGGEEFESFTLALRFADATE